MEPESTNFRRFSAVPDLHNVRACTQCIGRQVHRDLMSRASFAAPGGRWHVPLVQRSQHPPPTPMPILLLHRCWPRMHLQLTMHPQFVAVRTSSSSTTRSPLTSRDLVSGQDEHVQGENKRTLSGNTRATLTFTFFFSLSLAHDLSFFLSALLALTNIHPHVYIRIYI